MLELARLDVARRRKEEGWEGGRGKDESGAEGPLAEGTLCLDVLLRIELAALAKFVHDKGGISSERALEFRRLFKRSTHPTLMQRARCRTSLHIAMAFARDIDARQSLVLSGRRERGVASVLRLHALLKIPARIIHNSVEVIILFLACWCDLGLRSRIGTPRVSSRISSWWVQSSGQTLCDRACCVPTLASLNESCQSD